jgi:hypothetical protein
MLQEARDVIQEAENIFIRLKIGNKVFSKPVRCFIPIVMIQVGLGEFFLWARKYGMIVFLLTILALVIFNLIPIGAEEKQIILKFCIYLPLFLVIFDLPSSYSFDSIKMSEVNRLVNFMVSIGLEKSYQLVHLAQVINQAKDRVNERNKKLKWLLALYVAVATYMLNQAINIRTRISDFKLESLVNDLVGTVLINFIILLLAYVVISSYRKANDAIFKRIELAIFELQKRAAHSSGVKKTQTKIKDRLKQNRMR